MAAPKGTRPPAAGRGRKKGTLNKITRDLKEAILNTFQGLGGEDWLRKQAEKNPVAFMTLLARVLPLQVSAPDGPVLIVTGVPRSHEPGEPDPKLGQSTVEPIDVTPSSSKLTH